MARVSRFGLGCYLEGEWVRCLGQGLGRWCVMSVCFVSLDSFCRWQV